MLGQVQAGCLLLFDRGYFSFAWFDELTQRGIWWVSRYGTKASFRVAHIANDQETIILASLERNGKPEEHPLLVNKPEIFGFLILFVPEYVGVNVACPRPGPQTGTMACPRPVAYAKILRTPFVLLSLATTACLW
jgi:hypothetical protein